MLRRFWADRTNSVLGHRTKTAKKAGTIDTARPMTAKGSKQLTVELPVFYQCSYFFVLQQHRCHLKTNAFGIFYFLRPFNFQLKFYWLFMVFHKHPRGEFLDGLSNEFASTGRFWCHIRISDFPKVYFRQQLSPNKSKGAWFRSAPCILGATLLSTDCRLSRIRAALAARIREYCSFS